MSDARLRRMVEVWEKGSDGAFLGRIELLPALETGFLYQLFAAEQQEPDPQMRASYWLDADKCAVLQPFSPQPLEPEQFDYILSVSVRT